MLNVLVPEIVLERPRVLTIVGELKPAGMAQHVRMDWERHLRGLTEPAIILRNPTALIGALRSLMNT